MAGDDLLTKSTAGASYLVIGQIATKLFTFLLNQLLIRFISPKVFGIASNLEVLLSTILIFSREGVRLSIQRTDASDDKVEDEMGGKLSCNSRLGGLQSVINFGYLALLAGIPISSVLFYWQSNTQVFQLSKSQLLYFSYSIGIIWLLMVLELLAEPLYVLNQFQLNFGKRTKFESFATFARCITTFGVVISHQNFSETNSDVGKSDGVAVLAFTLGQLAYSFSIFALYQLDFKFNHQKQGLSLKVQKIHTSKQNFFYLNPKIFQIWKNIFIQMLFKQFLTEGDRLLINYVCTVEEQGVYAVVTNYGSLVARLLFQPIEESLRLYLTRLLSSPTNENLTTSKQIMKYLCIFYLNLSFLILLAGFANGSILLKILLGSRGSIKWLQTDLFTAFPQYILYIPFLAFNGILEAFFNSVATKENISNHSIFMSFLTIAFLLALYIFIQVWGLGLLGLILANTFNMAIRIVYCLVFIKGYYNLNSTIYITATKRLLGPLVIAISLEYLQYLVLDGKFMSDSVIELLKSVVICLVFLFSTLVLERDIILGSIKSLLNRKEKQS